MLAIRQILPLVAAFVTSLVGCGSKAPEDVAALLRGAPKNLKVLNSVVDRDPKGFDPRNKKEFCIRVITTPKLLRPRLTPRSSANPLVPV